MHPVSWFLLGRSGCIVTWCHVVMCSVSNTRTSRKPIATFQGENICHQRKVWPYQAPRCLCCDDPTGICLKLYTESLSTTDPSNTIWSARSLGPSVRATYFEAWRAFKNGSFTSYQMNGLEQHAQILLTLPPNLKEAHRVRWSSFSFMRGSTWYSNLYLILEGVS